MKNRAKRKFTVIVSAIALLALLASALVIPALANTGASGETEYDAEIMKVKGGRDAIATFTFDDGMTSTAWDIHDLFTEREMPATLVVVPSRVQGISPYGTKSYASVAELRELMASGYLEVQSHSYSHLYIRPETASDYEAHKANNTDENRYRETVGSREWLSAHFPKTHQIVFATPGGNYDDATKALVSANFYAARAGSGTSVNNYQSLTPANTSEPGGWYAVRTQWLNESQIDNIKAYLDACVNGGGWFIAGMHNTADTVDDVGKNNQEMTVATLAGLLDYTKAYSDAGKVWVASFSEATKYLREVESSEVRQYSDASGMYVELTMADETPHGLPLDPSVFNMPLTVKVEVPADWSGVTFRQNGSVTEGEIFTEGGKSYAYYDMIPNSGRAVMTESGTALESFESFAELTLAKGGATSIATMMFDDGHLKTAAKLNELCAKYGTKATLVIISNRYVNYDQNNLITYEYQTVDPETGEVKDNKVTRYTGDAVSVKESAADAIKAVLEAGYLDITSHSRTHVLGGKTEVVNNYKLDEEGIAAFFEDEITRSIADLKLAFPNEDVLTFGIPSSNYHTPAYDEFYKSFYAVRGGLCVLYDTANRGKMQSIDPETGKAAGSWYNPYGVRLMQEKNLYSETNSIENIIGYLDKCVENEGWFIGTAHGIVEGENYDISVEELSQLMSKMQEHQEAGKLWVATYNEATKYVRERQGSAVKAYTTGDGVYRVNVTMDATTPEGLPLSADIFNMPLTVKLEVPSGWRLASYRQAGGEVQTAECFTEDGKNYAYVDLVPNGGEAVVSYGAEGEKTELPMPVGYYEAPEGSWTPADDTVAYATFTSEDDFLKGNVDPIATYTDTVITNTAIQASGVGYVHVFKNITSTEKLKPNLGVNLVINLGGKIIDGAMGTDTVDTAAGTVTTITLKNGTYKNSGQLHLRRSARLVMDNLDVFSLNGTFGYGVCADSWIIRNSRVVLANSSASSGYFKLSGGASSSAVSELLFENTDLTIGGACPADGIFQIIEPSETYLTAKWKITFDKNSSLSGDITTLVSCTALEAFTATQKIFFEEGCTFSEGAKPDYKYKYIENSVGTVKDANDEICKIALVKPNTEYSIIGNEVYTYIPETYMYVLSVPEGTVDIPLGGFVAPEGAWYPTDSAVTYAIWNSRYEYENNFAPKLVFTSSSLNVSDVLLGGYLHLFRDVTASAQLAVNSNASLEVNLAGHTLVTPGLRPESNATLTLSNGTLKNSAYVQPRSGTTIIFTNLHIINSKSQFLYGAAGRLVRFERCLFEQTADPYSTYDYGLFYLAPGAYSESVLEFIDTDLDIKATSANGYALFKFQEAAWGNIKWRVRFDKDSSVKGNIPMWFKVSETTVAQSSNVKDLPYITETQLVYIEEGFRIYADAYAAFEFKYNFVGLNEGKTALLDMVKKDAVDSIFQILVVKPGETVATEEEFSFVLRDGVYTLDIADETEEPDIPTDPTPEPEPDEGWTPATGTTYAVFDSKATYEAGGDPIGEYTGNITIANITADGVGYVLVVAEEIAFADKPDFQSAVNVTIDLDGNILNNSYGISLLGGASFTIENGTYNHLELQIYYAPVSYMTYRNLTINFSASTNLSYGYGATKLLYDNCVINVNVDTKFSLGSQSSGKTCAIEFVSTDIVLNTNLSKPLFYIKEGSWGYNAGWTVTFDGDSSIKGTGTMPALVGLEEAFRYATPDSYHEKFVKTQNFVIADGFEVSEQIIDTLGIYLFRELDFDASVAAQNEVFKDSVILPADDELCKVSVAGLVIGKDVIYANPSSESTYKLSQGLKADNAGWYIKNTNNVMVGKYAVKDAKGRVPFTSADLMSFLEGTVIYFASDVVTTERITNTKLECTDITFDLGGNTMYLEGAFNLSLYKNGVNNPYSLTWKNGTIESSISQPFYGGGHLEAVFTFDNITLNYSGASTLVVNSHLGTIVAKNNTVVNAPGKTAFGFDDKSGYQSVVIEDSVINAGSAIMMSVNDSILDDVYIKNSVLNVTKAVAVVRNGFSTENSLLKINIIGCYIDGSGSIVNAMKASDGTYPGTVVAVLSETSLVEAPTVMKNNVQAEFSNAASVVTADGELLIAVSDPNSKYTYVATANKPDIKDKLQTNLTLATDFKLNFFADPSLVADIKLNGVSLDSELYEGSKKYTVRFAAHEAAEALSFEITVTEGGVSYTFEFEYSVLKYAQRLIASDKSEDAKTLSKAAVAYIKEAYLYANRNVMGYTLPEELAAFSTDGVMAQTAAGTENYTSAISGAQLFLDDGVKILLKLSDSYTGTLTVGGKSYNVSGGTAHGSTDTIVINDMKAKDLYDASVAIVAGTEEGEFTLAAYVANDTAAKALLDALYTYCYYADFYAENHPNLD